jgi:hypothetical protein
MKMDDSKGESHPKGASGEGSDALAAVGALMNERRQFEAWISALEARRSTTPEHVFSRVHADYTARLEAVIIQLTTHTEGLRREMDALSSRLGGIRDERQRAEDERAEAELRAHVGELSAADWESTAKASDAKLAELVARHSEVERDLQKTRELLEAAQRPVTPPGQAPAASAAPEAPKEAPKQAPPAPAPAPKASEVAAAPAPIPTAPRQPAFRVIHQTPAPGMPPIEQHALEMDDAPIGTPASGRGAAAPRKSSFDELAFLSSVVDTPSGSIEPAPTDQADEKSRRDSFAMRATEDTIANMTEGVPLVSPTVDQRELDSAVSRSARPDAMVGRDALVDGAKTLKCSECGAMNYPTEWYCERCGAELASL